MIPGLHIAVHPERPITETADLIAGAERLGFTGAWIADSQNLFRDVFAALALAAERTSTIRLGTGVTNPVTRHPAVIASAAATIDELSGGRLTVGVGTGETSVQTIGKRSATLAELEATTMAIRALMRGEVCEFDGASMTIPWSRRSVPVYIASTGPRSIALAGRIADGVYLKIGAHPDLVRYASSACRHGADASGRNMNDLAFATLLPCAISEDLRTAREEVSGFATAIAVGVLNSVPAECIPEYLSTDLFRLKEAADRARNQQSYVEWLQSGAYRSVLTDEVVDAFSVAGTQREVIERLEELGELGITDVVVPFVMSDPEIHIHALARELSLVAIR